MLKIFLKELRRQRGMTQKEVANHLKMSTARYNQYETGKRMPDYDTLLLIADYYGVSTDYLLGHLNYSAPVTLDPQFVSLVQTIYRRPSLQTLVELAAKTSEENISIINQYIRFVLEESEKTTK